MSKIRLLFLIDYIFEESFREPKDPSSSIYQVFIATPIKYWPVISTWEVIVNAIHAKASTRYDRNAGPSWTKTPLPSLGLTLYSTPPGFRPWKHSGYDISVE